MNCVCHGLSDDYCLSMRIKALDWVGGGLAHIERALWTGLHGLLTYAPFFLHDIKRTCKRYSSTNLFQKNKKKKKKKKKKERKKAPQPAIIAAAI